MIASNGRAPSVRIGTSGWHYGHWSGPFYPRDLPLRGYLPFYGRSFATVEINSTFYGVPRVETVRKWREATSPGFCFSVKANRYITHRKRLKGTEAAATRFLEVVGELGDKLGPILFQLPPRFRADEVRLDHFLAALPRGVRCAFEFRDPSWFVPEVAEVLRHHEAAFCIYDQGGLVTPLWVTAPFVYLRLHGAGDWYQGFYTDEMLSTYAACIRGWAGEGREVFCYFNNDLRGYAVANALTLIELITPS